MIEYIKREDVLQHKRKMRCADFHGGFWDFIVLCEDVERIPAADVVEVVRCKVCKYAEKIREEERSIYKKDVVVCGRCMTLDNKRPGNWYCPEGAKMDGKGEGE